MAQKQSIQHDPPPFSQTTKSKFARYTACYRRSKMSPKNELSRNAVRKQKGGNDLRAPSIETCRQKWYVNKTIERRIITGKRQSRTELTNTCEPWEHEIVDLRPSTHCWIEPSWPLLFDLFSVPLNINERLLDPIKGHPNTLFLVWPRPWIPAKQMCLSLPTRALCLALSYVLLQLPKHYTSKFTSIA